MQESFQEMGTYLVIQLLLGVERLQVEEILLEKMDVGLEKGLTKSLGNKTTTL
jgi:hypothetical protein